MYLRALASRSSEISVSRCIVRPQGAGRLPFWVILINKSAFQIVRPRSPSSSPRPSQSAGFFELCNLDLATRKGCGDSREFLRVIQWEDLLSN